MGTLQALRNAARARAAVVAATVAAVLAVWDSMRRRPADWVDAAGPAADEVLNADPAVLVQDARRAEVARMAGLLADQLVAAGRDPKQAAIWGQAIVGMVRSVADQWLRSGASASGTDRSQLATDVSTLIWGGLASTWD